MKLIKYKNRKVYYPAKGGYIPSTEILAAVRAGIQVSVEDYATGNDITDKTLLIMAIKHIKSYMISYEHVREIIQRYT